MEGEDRAKAAPITLDARLLEERLMLRERIESLERDMARGIYKQLSKHTRVLCRAQLFAMRFYIWILACRMDRL